MSQFSQIMSRVLSLISVVLYNQMVLEWTSRCSASYMMNINCMHIITCMLNIPMHTNSLEFSDYHVLVIKCTSVIISNTDNAQKMFTIFIHVISHFYYARAISIEIALRKVL